MSSMDDFEKDFFGYKDNEPVPDQSQFLLKDVEYQQKLEFMTDGGGFSFITVPWSPRVEPHDGKEVLCIKVGGILELNEWMDKGFFIAGGTERNDREVNLGVVERDKPLLYRPIRLIEFDEAMRKGKVSEDGAEYYRQQGYSREYGGIEYYLQPGDICASGLVKSVRLFERRSAAEQQEPKRLI